MKKHLNTLFITLQGAYLSKEGECIEIHTEGRSVGKIPIHTLDSVVCFGQVSCSPFVLDHCAKNGVAVTWLSEYGRFMAALQGPTRGNVLLRRAQYHAADSEEKSVEIARAFLIGKIYNARTVLMRQARLESNPKLDSAIDSLGRSLSHLPQANGLDFLRGIEGDAAHVYFSVFDSMLKAPSLQFKERSRRPPLNEVNCLLSFFYTLLMHDIRSALEGVGLDPQVGFLHRERPGRHSLALDMMEEFRAYLPDRLTLTLLNKKQITAKDFKRTASGAVLLKEKSRKELLAHWQERKQMEIEHPFLGERMSVGLLWHMQARLLARFLRGDLDAYPVFVIR